MPTASMVDYEQAPTDVRVIDDEIMAVEGIGQVWIGAPATVFLRGSAMALGSMVLPRLIPEHPAPGQEVRLAAWPVAVSTP